MSGKFKVGPAKTRDGEGIEILAVDVGPHNKIITYQHFSDTFKPYWRDGKNCVGAQCDNDLMPNADPLAEARATVREWREHRRDGHVIEGSPVDLAMELLAQEPAE